MAMRGRGGLRKWVCVAVVIIVLALAAVVSPCVRNDHPKAFVPIPSDAEFVSSSASRCFAVEGVVTLRGSAVEGHRLVTSEVKIENATGEPISGLLVTAELPAALASYSGGQFLTFGQMDAMDLVPGRVPYGLIVSREQTLPDPTSMSVVERNGFYGALTQPIRVALWWQGGEEYLTLGPEHISYVGFPGLGQ